MNKSSTLSPSALKTTKDSSSDTVVDLTLSTMRMPTEDEI